MADITAKNIILKNASGEYVVPFTNKLDKDLADLSETGISVIKSYSGTGNWQVGDIGMALYVDETTNERRILNGQTIITDQFTALYTWLNSLSATYPNLFCTLTEYNTIVANSAYSQCGKFVIDTTAGTIKLPTVVNVQGLTDLTNAGVIVNTGGTTGGESIQYPYFIQVNTGSTTTSDFSNKEDLCVPFSLFEPKLSDSLDYNSSWLHSNGQWNSGTVYVTAYEALLVEYNASIGVGETATLPTSGNTYTKRGLSVLASTETYTDYDFVINTTDSTFRLPLASNAVTPSGGGSWGSITGTLSDQTDLQTALNAKANTADLSTVATSGSYNDLSNTPTIPTATSQLTNDSGFITAVPDEYVTETELTAKGYATTSSLATVATSGSYNDLSNTPTIPTATSQLTNDSGFITTVPDEYVTETEMNTALSAKVSTTGDAGTLTYYETVSDGVTAAKWLVLTYRNVWGDSFYYLVKQNSTTATAGTTIYLTSVTEDTFATADWTDSTLYTSTDEIISNSTLAVGEEIYYTDSGGLAESFEVSAVTEVDGDTGCYVNDSSSISIESSATTINVQDGTTGKAWTKVVHCTASSPVVVADSNWNWQDGEAPDLYTGGYLVCCWLGSAGILIYQNISTGGGN